MAEPLVTVWATVDVPGMHFWAAAPTHRAYLRTPHRHLFRLRAEVQVSHDDRAVEFHDLQNLMREWWAPYALTAGSRSCEDLARSLGDKLRGDGLTPVSIDVSEDQENGATVRYEATA